MRKVLKVFHHEEHEGHEEWNLMNYLNELLEVKGIHKAQLLTYYEDNLRALRVLRGGFNRLAKKREYRIR